MTKEIDLGEPENVPILAKEGIRMKTPILYANQVNFANTPWDIQMIFGHLRATKVGEAVIEELATVVMSPVHAKIMAQIMRTQVERYEAQFGEINLRLDVPAETHVRTETEVSTKKPRRRRSSK